MKNLFLISKFKTILHWEWLKNHIWFINNWLDHGKCLLRSSMVYKGLNFCLLLCELLINWTIFLSQAPASAFSNESVTIKGKQFFIFKMIGRGGSSKVCDKTYSLSFDPVCATEITRLYSGLSGVWPEEARVRVKVCESRGGRCSGRGKLQEWDRALESSSTVQRSDH